MGCALVDLATNRIVNIIVADPSYVAPQGQQAVFFPDGNWSNWTWSETTGFIYNPVVVVPAPLPIVSQPPPVIEVIVPPPVIPDPTAASVTTNPTVTDAPIPPVAPVTQTVTGSTTVITETSSAAGG